MVTAQNIQKTYGKNENMFTALKDITFQIEDKSTLAIIGKSGSGKSTLMHVLSGLEKPTSGTVLVNNQDIFKLKPKEKDNFRATEMSFIFQSFFVEANQTCYQNVMLPLEIARTSPTKRKSMVAAALKAVGLENKTKQLAGNLSGGQKQRLAIARAIVNKPSILFADEPTGNLDSVTGKQVMDLLFGLNQKIDCTLILVTHDVDLASRCQVQLSLSDGQIASFKSNLKRV